MPGVRSPPIRCSTWAAVTTRDASTATVRSERNGGWYGQWRVNGKLRKRRIGDIRGSGGPEGLTRRQADAVL